MYDSQCERTTCKDKEYTTIVTRQWANVFGQRNVDGKQLTKHLRRVFSLGSPRACSLTDIQGLLAERKISAPGPDGTPFECWRQTNALSSRVFPDAFNTFEDARGSK